jgi:alpha-beta hydrolase superfamily lysophospholipase
VNDMAVMPTPTSAPIVFGGAESLCFGWFHPAQSPSRRMGVLLCRPMGYEALCSYRSYTSLAHTLAKAGFDVVSFDYHGTGDSPGGDTDADRVPAWLGGIAAAADELKRLGGVSRIALFGLRLGATLAAEAAVRMGGVDSLVMWAPCTSGRALVRELRAASACRAVGNGTTAPGDIEALGCLYTSATVRALQSLDCEQADRAPARRALIIGRDDMPHEGPLPAKYRDLGVDTRYAVWPGYTGMMAEPHQAVLEPATLASITAWLSETAAPQDEPRQAPELPAWPVDHACEGGRELPLRFGPNDSLFGILTEPAGLGMPDRRAETAILMLNVGGHYRIGPNRLYVKAARALAAAGYRTFRFDLTGIGDSRADVGFSSRDMYSRQCVGDVRAAIDFLAARGCRRFHVMGLCSGSYAAFQTALAEPRIEGQILMNSRLLEWDEEKGGTWQTSMQQPIKSTDYYRRALLQANVYPRLLRGEINVRGIAGRVAVLVQARLKRAFDRLVRRGSPEEGVLAKVRHLSDRGTDTLMIMSAQDDGLDYVEFHLGRRGCYLRGDPKFRMVVVEDSDHTFSTRAMQRVVIDTVQQHLDRLHQQPAQWSAAPGLVATT